MAITTPDAVPGELIMASWGDAVRADLTNLDSDKFDKTGGTVSGLVTANGGVALPSGEPSTAARAPRKDWVDTNFVNKTTPTAQTMAATLTVNTAPNTTGGQGVQVREIGTVESGTTTDDAVNFYGYKTAANLDVGDRYLSFWRAGTQIGTCLIASGGASVTWSGVSDPRAKTGAETRTISDAAARAVQLGRLAWRGQYIDHATGEPAGVTWDFLSSHDIEEVAPYAVHGARDAVDDEGKPQMQQVDYSTMVPLLFAALAEALDRIAALEGAGP
jgi:hypothetical protein